LSRVALVICGVAILAAVAMPLQSYYDERYDSSMEETADRISYILDEFWASEADTLTIRGWEVLPSSDSFIEIGGHDLTVHMKDKTYRSLMSKAMDEILIGHGDVITISKTESEERHYFSE
jgi:hypothetical protein